LVARMHLDLNTRDRIRFNQFFDCRHMCWRPKIREGFEAAFYNAGASTHMSPDKNPPTVTIFSGWI
jgi:hypothetical protein